MKLNFIRLLLAASLVSLFCFRHALAGDFNHINENETLTLYNYEGTVEHGDADKLRDLDSSCDKELVIVVDSPGGAAYEGVALYWAAKDLKLKTVAGTKFGAYSAAALFWAGGSGDLIPGSLAGFHLAYCNPYNPPGCYVADIDSKVLKCMIDKFGRERACEIFNQMNIALDKHGVRGFVMFKMGEDGLKVVVEDPTKYIDSFPVISPSSLKEADVVNQLVAPLPPKARKGSLPVTRFTSIPFITRHGKFRVELSAYHASGIRGVAFIIDGKDGKTKWVTKMTPGPTGYYEYAVEIDPADYDGLTQVEAVVYPNDGPPRRLSGNSLDHADIKNGKNGFWFNAGNDLVVTVGPSRQFKTVSDAVAYHKEALTKGGTIVLDPGAHFLDMPALDNEGFALTVSGRDRVTILNPGSLKRAQNNSNWHFKGIRFEMDIAPGRMFKNCKDGRLMLEDCTFSCSDPDGYRKQGQYIGKSVSSEWSRGMWLEDVDILNVWKGALGVANAKRIYIDRNTGDCFGSSPGGVFDIHVDNVVKDETFHGQHCDIVQFSTGEVTENRIVADVYSPKHQAQIGHMSKPAAMKDIAFVNWRIDARTAFRAPNLNLPPSIDNLIMHSLWFHRGSLNFVKGDTIGTVTNVSIRDCLFEKNGYHESPFAPSEDDIEIYYTRKMPRDWGNGVLLDGVVVNKDLSWSPVISF